MRWLREESSRGWGWMVGTVLSLSVLAADGPDQVAFNAALRSFSIGAYPRAAEEFTAFSSQFPDSALRPEALRRALYAQGEAEAGRGDHAAAQKTFDRVNPKRPPPCWISPMGRFDKPWVKANRQSCFLPV